MGFLFGSNAPATTQVTGEEYLQQPSQQVAGALGGIAAQPYQPYQGPRIAAMTPDQLAAMQQTREMGGIAGLGMEGAMGMTQEGAGAVTPGEIQGYMNPYMQQVAGQTAEEMERRAAIQNQQMRTQATTAGAWGGGRHAIQEAESERNLQRGLMDMYTQQYGQAWQQGLGTAERARQRQMQGGQQLGAQVGRQQEMGYRDISALGRIGEAQQGQQQQNISLAYQDFLRQQQYPMQQLGSMTDIIGGLRTPQAGTTAQTQPKEGAFGSLAGLGIAALGAFM